MFVPMVTELESYREWIRLELSQRARALKDFPWQLEALTLATLYPEK